MTRYLRLLGTLALIAAPVLATSQAHAASPTPKPSKPTTSKPTYSYTPYVPPDPRSE